MWSCKAHYHVGSSGASPDSVSGRCEKRNLSRKAKSGKENSSPSLEQIFKNVIGDVLVKYGEEVSTEGNSVYLRQVPGA